MNLLNGVFVPTYAGPLITDIRFRREYLGESEILYNYHLPSWQKGNVGGVVVHIHSIADTASVLAEVENSHGELVFVKDPAGFKEAVSSGKVAIMLCASFDDVGLDVNLLSIYERLGTVSFALSLNTRNMLVDGCAERTQAGLSARGIEVVKRLRQRGILIDVSHTSDKGFWDVMDTVDGGVIASHSNARALCKNPRNLTDEMIRAIADRGGVIGISTYPTLLTADAEPDIRHAVEHIEYIAELVGIEHLAVGADFINFAAEFVLPKIRSSDIGGSLYGPQHTSVKRLASISDLPNLAEQMKAKGFSEDQVQQVMGSNFLRVWEEAQAQVPF